MNNVETFGLKDSGDRTQFESGAVRDMHEGKGRFDLLPMCVLMRLAKHYEAGSKKYGDRNWEKGIPCHSYADSAMRHFVKYMDGWVDEDHLIAAIWNLCCLAWTEEKRPDLMDIPARLFKLEQKKRFKFEKPKAMKGCTNCKYQKYSIDFEPCHSCSGHPNYDKWEEETDDPDLKIIPARVETYPELNIIPARVKESSKVRKDCMSCKYERKSMECEPCSSCVGHDKWEEKTNDKNENL